MFKWDSGLGRKMGLQENNGSWEKGEWLGKTVCEEERFLEDKTGFF